MAHFKFDNLLTEMTRLDAPLTSGPPMRFNRKSSSGLGLSPRPVRTPGLTPTFPDSGHAVKSPTSARTPGKSPARLPVPQHRGRWKTPSKTPNKSSQHQHDRTPCSDRSDASDSRLEYRTTVHLPAVATKSRDSLARPARDRVSGAASGQVPSYLPLLGGIEGFGIVGHDHKQKSADGAAAWLEKQKEAADRTKQKYVKMAEHINRPSAPVMPPIHHKPQMTNAADGAGIWKTEKIIKEKQAANRIHLGNIISEIKAEIIDHGKLMVPSEGHFRSSTPPGLATCNMRSASLDNVFGFGNLSDAAREEELDRRRQEMADKREQERKVKGRKGEKKGGKKLKKRED